MVRLSLLIIHLRENAHCGCVVTGIARSGLGISVLQVRIQSSGSSSNPAQQSVRVIFSSNVVLYQEFNAWRHSL